MGFFDALGQAFLDTAAEVLVDQALKLGCSEMSDKELVEKAFELQLYFDNCEEDDQDETYVNASKLKPIVESNLEARGYTPVTIYLNNELLEQCDTLYEILQNM